MATIKDVSRLANVSISTVSRVINNTAPVHERSRDRVHAAMEELGYQPNLFAQGLVTNRSQSITLVLRDIAGAYFGPFIKIIENTLRAQGFNLIVSVENEGIEEVREAFRHLKGRRSDAVILFPHCLTDEEVIELSHNAPPMVILNRYIPDLSHQFVMFDNLYGSQLAVEYLISKGHQDIACIYGPLANGEAATRLNGYRQTLREHDLKRDEILEVQGHFSVEGGYQAAKQLMESGKSFSAVFSCNDEMAAGAMKAFKHSGLRVPEDISIIGLDDVQYASLLSPELTTIRQPVEAMAKAAANLAISLVKGNQDIPEQRLFQPELVERESVVEK